MPREVLESAEINVMLIENEARYDSIAPGAPDWSGGLALLEADLVLLPTFGGRAGRAPLASVLRHELAHIALGRYLGSAVPRWFHEGYAQLAAGSWDAGDAWSLRLAILAGRLSSLDSLALGFRRERIDAHEAYLLAYVAVDGLYRMGGEPGLARFLERWKATGDIDVAMRATYGLTFGQYERLWRREIKRRFGWLLLATQTTAFWTALTIVLVFLGLWKKKRDRRKLEAMIARERLEAEGWEAPEGQEPWAQD